ncbi:hypothetical protein FF1_002635 [Malus domestica]
MEFHSLIKEVSSTSLILSPLNKAPEPSPPVICFLWGTPTVDLGGTPLDILRSSCSVSNIPRSELSGPLFEPSQHVSSQDQGLGIWSND